MINLTVIKVSCVDHKFVSCKFSAPVQAINMYKIMKKKIFINSKVRGTFLRRILVENDRSTIFSH